MAILFLLLIAVTFSSCIDGGTINGADGDSENGGETEMMSKDTLYYGDSEIMLLISGEGGSRAVADKLIKALNENILDTGRAFLGNVYVTGEYKNRIILGRVPEREISIEAYRLLEKIEKTDGKNESRYIIYADGGEICIAFEDNKMYSCQPLDRIVGEFIGEYILGKDHLALESGVIKSGSVDLDILQSEVDKIKIEEKWENLGAKLGDDDVAASLRGFFEKMFDPRVITLIGNLYDPASGLFYASTSGKRAEGIYPNPEASNQALGYLESVLDIPNALKDYLPDAVGYKMIYYAKSIQAEDGEFYISQIKKSEIPSNRLGNDRSSCLGILRRFGASPTYTVGSVQGDGITAEEYWADLVKRGLVSEEEKPVIYWGDPDPTDRVSSLSESKTVAVSRAVAASGNVAASATSHFQSHEAFVNWLLQRDGYNDPYTAMSNTLAASSLISDWSERLGGYGGDDKILTNDGRSYELKRGETLYDILINWTNGYINEAGLFGKVTNNYVSDENGKYVLQDGEYVLAEDGNGDYSPVYDGFFGGWGYQNSNGFHKAIARYSNIGMAYPAPRAAAESLLKGIASDEPIGTNILVILNVWTSLNSLKNNVQRHYTGEDKQEILDLIDNTLWGKTIDEATGESRTYAALAIDKCLEKLLAFKKSDGGFGHNAKSGTAVWQGGLNVGIASDNLSDMNAIACTASALGNRICSVLGFDMSEVPLHTETDLNVFLATMSEQPYVVKASPLDVKPSN